MKKEKPCPFVVMHHTIGLPDHLDTVQEELTELLHEQWELAKLTEKQAIDEVNTWSTLGDETERRLYARRIM